MVTARRASERGAARRRRWCHRFDSSPILRILIFLLDLWFSRGGGLKRTILRPFTTTVLLSCVLRTGGGFLSLSSRISSRKAELRHPHHVRA